MTRTGSLFFLLLYLLAMPVVGEGRRAHKREILYQVSTLNALLAGDYAGQVQFREVRKHGTFGLGTFDGLDGEMVVLDGDFYQIRTDGLAYPVDPRAKTPFAVVTFFKSDDKFEIDNVSGCNELYDAVASRFPRDDLPHAVKITGRFAKLETRSVPAQVEPFPPLATALQEQVFFDLHDVDATLVGFWLPEAFAGLERCGLPLPRADR